MVKNANRVKGLMQALCYTSYMWELYTQAKLNKRPFVTAERKIQDSGVYVITLLNVFYVFKEL